MTGALINIEALLSAGALAVESGVFTKFFWTSNPAHLHLAALPASFVEWCRSFEQGWGQKIPAGCGAVLNEAGFIFFIMVWISLCRLHSWKRLREFAFARIIVRQ